jgi:hypothetical protein
MAIGVDRLSIGFAGIDSAATTIPFTTTVTVAAGATIFLGVSWGDQTVTLSSVSGGGLSWTIDKQSPGNGNCGCAVVSAYAAAGLASGTVITATYSAAVAGRGIGGLSLTGVVTSSPLDTTTGPSDFSTAAWTTSTTIQAGSVIIAVAHGSQTNDSSTVTAPSVEALDFNGGSGTFCQTVCYRIEAVGGAYTVAGTWTGTEVGTAISAAYKAAAGAAAPAGGLPRTFNPVPFMSNGRI